MRKMRRNQNIICEIIRNPGNDKLHSVWMNALPPLAKCQKTNKRAKCARARGRSPIYPQKNFNNVPTSVLRITRFKIANKQCHVIVSRSSDCRSMKCSLDKWPTQTKRNETMRSECSYCYCYTCHVLWPTFSIHLSFTDQLRTKLIIRENSAHETKSKTRNKWAHLCAMKSPISLD